jgi:hypothetical protein
MMQLCVCIIRAVNTVSPVFVKNALVYLLTTKYGIEKTSFLWCNANVLRLNAPLVFMSLI